MALLWRSKSSDGSYEVRSAGRTVRLYTNGVFHSQWNPTRPLGNAIWDLMVLAGFPVSAARAGEPLRVLLLGVGGGAVVRQLHQLFTIDTVVGIEIDPTHIEIANRWFGIAKLPSVTLVQADAVDWVKNYKGPGFDLVIDDLFGHATTDVCRAVPFTRRWAKQLVALLEPDGAVVANTAGGVEFHQAAAELDAALAAVRGKQPVEISGIRLTHPDYDNQIGKHQVTLPCTTVSCHPARKIG